MEVRVGRIKMRSGGEEEECECSKALANGKRMERELIHSERSTRKLRLEGRGSRTRGWDFNFFLLLS